ncbi:MAG: hypothetical protein ACXV3D_02775 [Halobacteriota archaeon]
MKTVPIVITLVTLIMLAVAGCTSPTANLKASPCPNPSVTPNPTLVQYIDAYRQEMNERHPANLTLFNVTWKNNTAAYIQVAYTTPPYGNVTNSVYRENLTLIQFDTSNDIPTYVHSHTTNKTTLLTTEPLNSSYDRRVDAYKRMWGHDRNPGLYIMWASATHVSNTTVAENLLKYVTNTEYAEQIREYLWIGEIGDEWIQSTIAAKVTA